MVAGVEQRLDEVPPVGAPRVRRVVAGAVGARRRPKYAKRSIADHQNYGDDANAQELLYPSQLCAMGIDENEFFAKRPKADIWDLFTAIGWNLDDDKFHKLYDDVCDDDGMTNIETFRKILADKAL